MRRFGRRILVKDEDLKTYLDKGSQRPEVFDASDNANEI